MDERTLGERVSRLENILGGTEIANDRNEATGQCFAAVNLDKVSLHQERAGLSQTSVQTALEEIINRIQGCTDRVFKTCSRLEEIGNRVMGTLPEDETLRGAQGAGRSPDGTLDHTFTALNWLDSALQRLDTAATRLERV